MAGEVSSATSADVLLHFTRVKGALELGQTQVEGLVSFVKQRIDINESCAKSFNKLSKVTMGIDEKITEPTMFEALASLRGDIGNESFQHTEFASSVTRDVLDPLIRLKEGGETVLKIANRVKSATKELKSAHERCRKSYTKYIQLHSRAVGACSAASLQSPILWLPASESNFASALPGTPTPAPSTPLLSSMAGFPGPSSLSRELSNRSLGQVALVGASPARPPLHGQLTITKQAVSGQLPPRRTSAAEGPSSVGRSTAGGYDSPGGRSTNNEPPPIPPLFTPTVGGAGAEAVRTPFDVETVLTVTVGPSSDAVQDTVTRLDLGSVTVVDEHADSVHAIHTPFDESFGGADSVVDEDAGSVVTGELAPAVLSLGEASPAVQSQSSNSSGSSNGGALPLPSINIEKEQYKNISTRGIEVGEDIVGVQGLGQGEGADMAAYAGRALKSVASGIVVGLGMMLPHVPPAGNSSNAHLAMGTANMTMAERTEAQRAAAAASVEAVEESCSECKEAWTAHARAREKFNAQVASALVIFREIEKKRVAEVSDCLRRYTVFVSSLHANLQYDVQRLSGVVEALGDSSATTLVALQAFAAPVPSDDRLEFARIDAAMVNSIAAQASSSSGSAGNGGSSSRRNSSADAIGRSISFAASAALDVTSPDGSLSRMSSKMWSGLAPLMPLAGGSSASGGSGEGAQTEDGEGGPDSPSAHAHTHASSSSRPSGPPPSSATVAVADHTHPAIGLTVSYADPPTPEAETARRHSGIGAAATGGIASGTGMGRFWSMGSMMGGAGIGFAATGAVRLKPIQSSPLAPRGGAGLPSGRRTSVPGRRSSQTGSPGSVTSSGNGKGVSVSVSLEGSVRHNSSGTSMGTSMGVRETAALLEQLRVSPGPIEHCLEALFDPSGVKVCLAPDGSLVLLAEGEGQEVPQLSMEDFTTGRSSSLPSSLHDSPIHGRSRGGTAASSGSGTGESLPAPASFGHLAGPLEGSRPGSPDMGIGAGEGRPRSVSVIPLAEASFSALASGGLHSPRHAQGHSLSRQGSPSTVPGAGVEANNGQTGSRRGSMTAAPALSDGPEHGQLNEAVPILLPQACTSLRSSVDGVARLVMALEARRGDGTALSRPSFDALCAMLMAALDGAETRSDFARARALMGISQTFFCYVRAEEDTGVVFSHVVTALAGAGLQALLPPNAVSASTYALPGAAAAAVAAAGTRPRRMYAQIRVRSHSLWQAAAYWETAVYDSIGIELAKHGQAVPGGSGGSGPGSSGAGLSTSASTGLGGFNLGFGMRLGGSKEGRQSKAGREAAEREAQVAFGQLGFFAYTMIAFNVPEESVHKLLDKYARALRLDDARAGQLAASVTAFAVDGHKAAVAEAERIAAMKT